MKIEYRDIVAVSQGGLTMHVTAIIGEKGNAVYTAEPGQMISDVVSLLSEKRIGALVVVDNTSQVCGIISERDVIDALRKEGAALLSRPVKDYMSTGVVSCTMEDSIDHLMALMTSRRIRHLPVLDNGSLVGIISIGDVVKFRIAEAEAETDALKSYIASG
jgi:CBS domain-containing protein